MRKHLLPGSVAALLAATGLASAQQQPAPADTASVQSDGFSLTTGADYSTGKYGGTSSTDILYVPLTGAYEMDKWLFKVTVPYIMVTGPGNVVRGIGIIKNKAAGRRRFPLSARSATKSSAARQARSSATSSSARPAPP